MKMKKILAATLSATMIIGSSVPVLAADPTVTAPIYSFEVLDVVIPTTYAVAFNPEGLTVKKGTSNVTDQILSKSYGMINKGNKDQVFTVTLKIEDQNTGDDKVTFVESATDISNAEDGEYKIHLTAIPADTTEVQVAGASVDKDTAAAALDDVSMSGATAEAVTLKGGENKIAFKLDKASYTPKSGSEITLGTSNSNNVASSYELTSLAAAGKGITAFTFGGEMNANADWTQLTSGIKITAVYDNEVAPSSVTTISGTGAMIKVGPQVSINTSGVINITNLDGDLYQSISLNDGIQDYVLGDADGTWDWDTAENGKKEFTLSSSWMSGFLSGKTATVTVTLTDGTTIVSPSVTFS